MQFVINRTKATKGQTNTETLVVYPNPANAYFVVEIGDNYRVNAQVQIQDVKGALVQSINLHEQDNHIIINTVTWKSGVYLVNLYQNNKQVESMKIIVE